MELTGKIIVVCPEKSGVSASTGNPWKVQEYVLETHDQYPRRMCFSVFGEDKIKQFNIQQNQELTVSFDIDAREYNGRWFNSIRAWKVAAPQAAPAASQGMQEAPFNPTAQAAPATPTFDSQASAQPASNTGDSADDLPF